MSRSPRIVAELGRPETPDETAARKAASSSQYRASKTTKNLLIALVASLGIVAFLVLIVVRPGMPEREPIDFRAVAANAEPALGGAPVVPDVPESWAANAARIESGTDGVTSWYIGFLTPSERFIAVRQGVDANPSWLAAQLEDPRATGTVALGGTQWAVYDRRGTDPTGLYAYALSTTFGDSTIVLFGTAPDEEFTQFASLVAASASAGSR